MASAVSNARRSKFLILVELSVDLLAVKSVLRREARSLREANWSRSMTGDVSSEKFVFSSSQKFLNHF